MTIRVLVVDDDTLVRAGLRMMIETQEDLVVVGEAANGDDAVALARELTPDVVLMDIRMPGADGIEATRRITSALHIDGRAETPRVVILTTFEIDQYVSEAVRAGATGFLLKRTPPEDLLAGIRTIAEGEALLSPSVTRRLMREFVRATTAAGQATDVSNRDLSQLTHREREVLNPHEARATGPSPRCRLRLRDRTAGPPQPPRLSRRWHGRASLGLRVLDR